MVKSFKKFKRKVRAQAIASALLLGLGAGLVAFAAMTASAKLVGNELQQYYYAAFGGGSALLALILYFIFMPSDKRLAKRLDKLYSLDEKVATMVELRRDEGPFASLQREDADARLSEKPSRAFKSKPLIAGLLVFCIAIGSTVGAWIMPTKADAGETPIDEFDRQWIITTLNELISIVETAYIGENLRTEVLSELRSLLAFVQESDLLSEMKAEAIVTVIDINSSLKKANSAEAIGAQLIGSSNKELADFGKALSELSGTSSKKTLEALGKALSALSANDASFVAEELNNSLQRSGVRSDDEVYMLLKALVSDIKGNPSGASNACADAGKTLGSTVVVQGVNKTTVNLVINRLCNLFGITEDDITAVNPDVNIDIRDPSAPEDNPDDSEFEEPDAEMGSGGLGTGEVIYGSNDLVYDPATNTYRPYGELINEYYPTAYDKISDGKTSDEISEAVQEYFDILIGGNKEE